MADLLAGIIFRIDPNDDDRIIGATKPVIRISGAGTTKTFTMTFTVPNCENVSDYQYDETYLTQYPYTKAHLKYDSGAAGTITSDSITGIYLKQLGNPSSDRSVYFDFECTLDDGKIGGAGVKKKSAKKAPTRHKKKVTKKVKSATKKKTSTTRKAGKATNSRKR